MKAKPYFCIAALLLIFFDNSAMASGKRVAITIDDLPAASVVPISLNEIADINRKLLSGLNSKKVQAVGFVNESGLFHENEVDARIGILSTWPENGMELGNHTFGHESLWALPLTQYQDAIIRGEVVTRPLMERHGRKLRYFRHPYTQTGKNDEEMKSLDGFLQSRGYLVAPVTIENDDYLFSCVYDKGLTTMSEAERQKIIDAHLRHLDVAITSYEQMSDELFGRQIPQIFLIHANRINSIAINDILEVFQHRGYEFITLPDALFDPAYQTPVHASGKFGPSWMTRWAKAGGKKMKIYGHPDPSGWIEEKAKTAGCL